MERQQNTLGSKTARFNLRTNVHDKNLIDRAAKLKDMKVSQFILNDAIKKAKLILKEENSMVLSQLDQKAFVKAFLDNHEASPYLKKAIKEFK